MCSAEHVKVNFPFWSEQLNRESCSPYVCGFNVSFWLETLSLDSRESKTDAGGMLEFNNKFMFEDCRCTIKNDRPMLCKHRVLL